MFALVNVLKGRKISAASREAASPQLGGFRESLCASAAINVRERLYVNV